MLSDAIYTYVESVETPNWEMFDEELNHLFDSGLYDHIYTIEMKVYVYMRRRNRDALIALRVQMDRPTDAEMADLLAVADPAEAEEPVERRNQ
jgi:hypothetical protein